MSSPSDLNGNMLKEKELRFGKGCSDFLVQFIFDFSPSTELRMDVYTTVIMSFRYLYKFRSNCHANYISQLRDTESCQNRALEYEEKIERILKDHVKTLETMIQVLDPLYENWRETLADMDCNVTEKLDPFIVDIMAQKRFQCVPTKGLPLNVLPDTELRSFEVDVGKSKEELVDECYEQRKMYADLIKDFMHKRPETDEEWFTYVGALMFLYSVLCFIKVCACEAELIAPPESLDEDFQQLVEEDWFPSDKSKSDSALETIRQYIPRLLAQMEEKIVKHQLESATIEKFVSTSSSEKPQNDTREEKPLAKTKPSFHPRRKEYYLEEWPNRLRKVERCSSIDEMLRLLIGTEMLPAQSPMTSSELDAFVNVHRHQARPKERPLWTGSLTLPITPRNKYIFPDEPGNDPDRRLVTETKPYIRNEHSKQAALFCAAIILYPDETAHYCTLHPPDLNIIDEVNESLSKITNTTSSLSK